MTNKLVSTLNLHYVNEVEIETYPKVKLIRENVMKFDEERKKVNARSPNR